MRQFLLVLKNFFLRHFHFTVAATSAGLDATSGKFYGPITGVAARRKRDAEEILDQAGAPQSY